MHIRVALMTVLCALAVRAQTARPEGLNYNASKSNTGNLFFSDGTNCTTVVVGADASGNVTGSTSTTAPCAVANGEYVFPSYGSSQVPLVTTVIPQFVDGATWQTTVGIVNTTASAATANLSCVQETSAGDTSTQPWSPPFLGGSNTQNLSLGPGATIFLDTPGTSSALAEGWCQVNASNGVQVYSKFTWSATNGGQGIAAAAATGRDILVPFDNTGGSQTAVAIANTTPSNQPVTVSIQLASGGVSQAIVNLAPNGHTAFLFPGKFSQTAGTRGLAEFRSVAISLVPIQFNAVDNFTTATSYAVSNGPIIGVTDPVKCLQLPQASGCPSPLFTLTTLNATFGAAGATGSSVVINITPGANGTYNAAVAGTVNGTEVNGSFVGGTLTSNASGQLVFNFATTGPGSTFSSGVLSFVFTETSVDGAVSQASGTVSGQIALTQTGVGGGSVTGMSSINYNSSHSNTGN